MRIIGLVGVRGSGKDHFAKQKKEHIEGLGLTCEIISFADQLRKDIFEMFNITLTDSYTYENFKDDSFEYKGLVHTGRDLLENIGDEFTRKNLFCFVHKVNSQIKTSTKDVVIVTDVRLGREVMGLKYLALKMVHNAKFYFCNFKSERYDDKETQTNELALSVRDRGFKDGDDISHLF